MELQNKIQAAIEAHLGHTGDSQNALAAKLDVSPATVTSIKQGKWQNISPAMWNKVASFFELREDWQLFETPNYVRVRNLCQDAQKSHKMLAVAAFTGSGKTTALREYVRKNTNAYYLLCTAVMSRKGFVRGILRAMGLEQAGSIEDGMEAIIGRLNEATAPLLVLDDVRKLSDSVMRMIQTIYDGTEFRAGIVLAGTPSLKKYVDDMAGKDKNGFQEFKRRIQFWQSLTRPSKGVIVQFAQVFGVSDDAAVTYLVRIATDYGTLRNLLTAASEAVARKPGLAITAELLAGLHVGDHEFRGN